MIKKVTLILIGLFFITSFLFYFLQTQKVNQCQNICSQQYACPNNEIGCFASVCKESCNTIQLPISNTSDTFGVSIIPLNVLLMELFSYLVFTVSN